MRVRALESRRPEMAPKKAEAPVEEEGEDPRAAPRDNLLAVLNEKLRAKGTVRARPTVPHPGPARALTVSTAPPPLDRASSPPRPIGTHARANPPSSFPPIRDQVARGHHAIPMRVVFLAENNEKVSAKEASARHWEEILTVARDEDGGASAAPQTGVALVYPEATLVVLEASYRGVMAAARALEESLARAPFHSVRVCAATDDMAVAFPAFTSTFINAKTLDAYEPEEEERVLKTTSGVNVAMLKLGAMLRECAGDAGRMETTLRTLASGFTELPTMPQLMGLLRTEEGAPTLEEFLDVYDAALDVDLDSENVWPMPPPLRF